MAAYMTVAIAAANGDFKELEELIAKGHDVNERSREGMTPLGIAAFWGYAEIVELLLQNGADINLANKGTLWTPLHSASFQGHGKVVMKLMQYGPDLTAKDNQGRTAVDFASAIDGIWSFFAAAGCKRTTKAKMIEMDIVKKVTSHDPSIPRSDYAHFSRPGSAYVIKPQEMHYSDSRMAHASQTGDVLAGIKEENEDRPPIPLYKSILSLFNNNLAHASQTGDVLAGIKEEHEDRPPIPLYNSIWNS